MATLDRVTTLAVGTAGGGAPITELSVRGTDGGLLLDGLAATGAVRGTWRLVDGAARVTAAAGPGDGYGIDALRMTLSGARHILTDDQLGRIAATGGLTVSLDGSASYALRSEAVWVEHGTTDWLFLEIPGGGIARFDLSAGALAGSGTLSLTAAATMPGDPLEDLQPVTVGDTRFLAGAAAAANTVTVWRIGADGALTETAVAPDGIGMAAPSALVPVTVAGRTYLVVAGAGSSSLSVFELDADGGLTLADHVLDDRAATRFANAGLLDTVEHDGRTYILAAGSDDGFSVLTLLPGGRLVHLASIEDAADLSLADLSALTAVEVDGQVQVFAASETEPGVSQIAFDPGPAGVTRAGGGGDNLLTGSGGNDILAGGGGHDTLEGYKGDDILYDGPGADWMTGGPGADLFVLAADGARDVIRDFDPAEDRLDLSAFPMLHGVEALDIQSTPTGAILTWRGEETEVRSADGGPLDRSDFTDVGILNLDRPVQGLYSGTAPDENLLNGTEADDRLTGDRDGLRILGLGGADVLISAGGSGLLDGGAGTDCADYSAATHAVVADLMLGEARLGESWQDMLVGIENLVGSGLDDVLSGSQDANLLDGFGGADLIAGAGGEDTLYGGAGIDTLLGGGNHDLLYGQSAADSMSGGLDDDSLYGGAGTDLLEGGDGDDLLVGNTAADRLFGGTGDDSLYGGEGRDTLGGDDGGDRLLGGTGADSLSGGQGEDSLYGGPGADTLAGGGLGDYLNGATGADSLYGGYGDDTLVGSQGFDTLDGGAGDDLLSGGSLGDRLDGGTGDDTLDGGRGADVFLFRDGGGADVITDFDLTADRLWLDPDLWSGTLDGAGILARFADVAAGDTLLDFGGDSLLLAGVTDLSALADRIDLL